MKQISEKKKKSKKSKEELEEELEKEEGYNEVNTSRKNKN